MSLKLAPRKGARRCTEVLEVTQRIYFEEG